MKLILFGTPHIETDDGSPPFRRRKGLALLAYLAITQRPQGREALLGLLWPEFSPDSARNNLRRELSLLKKKLPENTLLSDANQISLDPNNALWVDALAFQNTLDGGAKTAIGNLQSAKQMAEAVSLYGDDFLAGFNLPNCLAFEEWQETQAAQYRQMLSHSYEALINWHAQHHTFDLASHYGRLWLALDTLHEPAHRRLMTLYAQSGQQAAALRQYQACVDILEEELGIPPELATDELIEAIKAQEIEVEQTAVLPPAPPSVPFSLPTPATPLIGRQKELERCIQLLAEDSSCRLLTLVGPGGIGKTRLALEAGNQLSDSFADGVVFIPLSAIESANVLAETMAAQLKMTVQGRTAVSQQLITQLKQKQRLLILDNFEQLISDEVGWLSDLLSQAPEIKLLITSRERLNLEEEWTLPLTGLDAQSAETGEAVALFIQRAQQAVATFAPTEAERLTIQSICTLVEGWPLGIILAASWVKMLSCQEILEEITASVDFLTTQARNVPERHRSMRAVLRQAWLQISTEEQVVLKRLSVFRGGFLREAASTIAGATLSTLSSLVDKSLLTFEQGNGRYRLHEFLRQYAAEKLAEHPDHEMQTLQAHATFYFQLLAFYDHYLMDMSQGVGIQHLDNDIDNIRLAWQTAVSHKKVNALQKGVTALGHFYYEKRWYQEGVSLFEQALAVIKGDTAVDQQLRAQLEIMMGCLLLPQGNLPEGSRLLRSGLKQAYHFEDGPFIGLGERWLGWGYYLQSKPVQAEKHLKKSIDVIRATGNIQELASPLNILGLVALTQQRFSDAKEYHLEALKYGEIHTGTILNNLAQLAVITGQYQSAQHYAHEGLQFEIKHNRKHSLPYLYANLARAKFALGDLKAARDYYDKDLTLSREAGDLRGVAGALDLLSKIALVEQQYEEAHNLLRTALSMNKPMEQKFGIASNHVNLGLLSCEQNDLEKAAELLHTGHSLWKAQNNIRGQARALALLAKVAVKENHFDEADAFLERAEALVDPASLLATWLWVKAHRAIFLAKSGQNESAAQLSHDLLANPATHYETRHYLALEGIG